MMSAEWIFMTLRKDLRQPLADVILSFNMSAGSLDLYERAECRPTLRVHDATKGIITPSHPSPDLIEWRPIDDCNAAVQTNMQRTNLIFFGIYCETSVGQTCQFSFNFAAHTVEILEVNEVLNRPLWERPGYQYFQMFPTFDPFRIVLQLSYPDRFEVAAAILVQKGTCATKYSHFAFQSANSSSVVLRGQRIDTYELEVDPRAYNLSGMGLEITAYTTAGCEGQLQCGFWTIAAYYSEEATGASLPSQSAAESSADSGTGLPHPSSHPHVSSSTVVEPATESDKSSAQPESSVDQPSTELPQSTKDPISSPNLSDSLEPIPESSEEVSDSLEPIPESTGDVSDSKVDSVTQNKPKSSDETSAAGGETFRVHT